MDAETRQQLIGDYNRNADGLPTDRNDDVEVRVEFVIFDGPEGARLQELQNDAVLRVLRALREAANGAPRGDVR
jgi:hypothetical protein